MILVLLLIAATSPMWLSCFAVNEFLHLKTGNVQSRYSFCGIDYYVTETPSDLSPAMSVFADELPDCKLRIRYRAGFNRYQLKGATCYSELLELILMKEDANSELTSGEIIRILDKYKLF